MKIEELQLELARANIASGWSNGIVQIITKDEKGNLVTHSVDHTESCVYHDPDGTNWVFYLVAKDKP